MHPGLFLLLLQDIFFRVYSFFLLCGSGGSINPPTK
jgi:hypothetical protein